MSSESPGRAGGGVTSPTRSGGVTAPAPRTAPPPRPAPPAGPTLTSSDRRAALAGQRRRFGGVKWGSAFFGWMTATGVGVLLTGLVVGTGTAVGFGDTGGGASRAVNEMRQAAQDPASAGTVGVIGGVVLLVFVLLAYYCGGYVAGRMARFDAVKQGLAVWLWAVVAAVLAGLLGAAAGQRFDVLALERSLPRLPINEGTLTAGGVGVAVLAVVVSLVGALLGAAAGVRFHRKVDRAGFEHIERARTAGQPATR